MILDLDETLIHTTVLRQSDQLEKFKYGNYNVYVRPHTPIFLAQMSMYYDLATFTASTAEYAKIILEHIDPLGHIKTVLSRKDCTLKKKLYVKDLSKFGRPMTDVVIVDNSPEVY